MTDVEIDQSGRTDVLTVDTVLALSNDLQVAILLPRSVKRECQAQLKARGMRQPLIGVRLFSAGLVLLMQECIHTVETVAIDLEYTGWEGEIKGHVLRQLRARGHRVSADQIVFRQIGKKSRAHDVAWRTLKSDRAPDRRISAQRLLEAC